MLEQTIFALIISVFTMTLFGMIQFDKISWLFQVLLVGSCFFSVCGLFTSEWYIFLALLLLNMSTFVVFKNYPLESRWVLFITSIFALIFSILSYFC